MNSKCKNCGFGLKDHDNFCGFCGVAPNTGQNYSITWINKMKKFPTITSKNNSVNVILAVMYGGLFLFLSYLIGYALIQTFAAIALWFLHGAKISEITWYPTYIHVNDLYDVGAVVFGVMLVFIIIAIFFTIAVIIWWFILLNLVNVVGKIVNERD